MASEIRVNSLTNRSGLSTVSITDTGAVISGIVTVSDTINAQSNINVSTNLSVSGVSTLGNTVVGGATTELIVGGDARITGILTIGTSSITLDGSNNTITSSNFVGNLSGNVVTTGVSTFKSLDYAGISSTISDTAVDIFVYDTSKDSDGGAWRYKTQRTSWYNETLNTSIRGSRREFPAVAVIVAESNNVKIYDGDDPDLPMWMVFEGNSSDMFTNGGTNYAVTALNGILSLGENGAIWNAHFISDRGDLRNSIRRYDYKGNIEQRNDGLSYTDQETSGALVNSKANDVAMTVLPNAPIDSTTGLPIPTIAVATDGGVSVIKDDGTVVDITAQSGGSYNATAWIDITKNNRLIFEQDSANRAVFCIPIPSADRITATSDGSITDKVVMKYYSAGTHIPYPCYFGAAIYDGISLGDGDNQALVGSNGELTILYPDFNAPANGKVAYITSDYNTGWMHGDIKGAFLSDTDATNVTGGALITGEDSNFNGGTIGNWVVGQNSGTALLTNSSNRLKLDTNSSSYPKATLNVGTQQPGLYTLAGEFYMSSAAVQIIYDTGGAVPTDTLSDTINTWHYFQRTFEMTTSFDSIGFRMNVTGGSHSAQFDNLTLSKADPDRSVNNKGLQVFGTINKSAVATGA